MPESKPSRTRAPTQVLPLFEHLRECFEHEVDEGWLWWRDRPRTHFPDVRSWKTANANFAGKRAGTISNSGYRRILLGGRIYLAHRIIWKLMTCEEPPETIDHIDHDRDNNAWSNLRAATQVQGKYNSLLRKDNKTGYRGVHPHYGGKWCVIIAVNGVKRWFGPFDTPEEASVVYEAMARELHGEFYLARGKRSGQ